MAGGSKSGQRAGDAGEILLQALPRQAVYPGSPMVGASLVLYAPIGLVTHRLGGGRMLLLGMVARLGLPGVLTAVALLQGRWMGWVILLRFALVQFAWPLLAVAANSLSIRLAPAAQGESVGLVNTATSLAAAAGSAVAGVVFGALGLAGLAGVTFAAIALAIGLVTTWFPRAVTAKA